MKFFHRLAVAAVSCLVHALALQTLSGDLHADALGAPVVVASPASVTPTYGATVSLASDVLAAPPATYVWQRNGVSIIDGGRYSGATTGTLVITRANNTDDGAYTLTVTNDLGTASTTPASVIVVQTPFALDPSQPVTSASTTTSSSDYANVILHLPDGRTLLGGRGAFNGAAGTSASSGLIVIEADGRVTVPACGAFNGEIDAIYRQRDGKILVSGYFSQINGIGGPGRTSLARLNPDLTVDPGFQPQASRGRHIFSDALGRVYIAGDFSLFHGDPAYQYLVRLQSDGSLDRSYRPQVDSGIRNIAFAPDGSVYLGGQLASYGYPATPANGVIRLRPDGRIDPAFACTLPDSLNITALAVQADGKLLVGSYSADAPLVRLFPDGTQDMSFDYDPATGSQSVAALAILPSGKILVGGSSATSANLLFRLDADGARDTTFDGGAGLAPPTGSYAVVNSIEPDPYGRPWIAGIHFTTYDGQPASRLAVLQGDSPVLAFTTQPAGLVRDLGASATFTAAATGDNGFTFRWHKNGVPLSDDGRISGATTPTLAIADLVAADTDDYTVVVTSPTTSVTSAAAKLIVRAAPLITWAPADVATDFGAAATFTSQAFGAAPLAYRWLHGSTELTDGTVDGVTISGASTPELTITGLTFAQAGEYRLRATNAHGTAVSDLARLTVTRRPGALAAGLGPIQPMPNGPVHAILRLADGSMLIAGDFTTIVLHGGSQNRGRIARFLADGTLDATFAPTFNDSVSSLAQDNAGRIFVGGSFTAVTFGSTTTTTRRVARLTAALALDTAFDTTTTGPNNSVEALAPTHDGGVYIGGFFSFFGATHTGYVVRLDATGSLDPAFNATNTISDGVRSLLLRADGRLYVGGRSGTFLLSATGVRDTGFTPHTANSYSSVSGLAMLLLPDNSLVVGGGSFSPSNYLRRLNSTTGASLADYGANHANPIGCLALQPDGKVLSGSFGVLKRTDPATGLDDTLEGGANIFAPFYFSAIRTIALDGTGRIWVGGYFSTYNNKSQPYLAILGGGNPGSRDGLLIPQTLTFTDIPDRILGANAATNTVTLAATSDRGLTPITYAVTSGSATISGTTLTITGAGDITVTATQAGDGTYAPATATQTFTVTKAEQTITFAAPASHVVGTKFTLTATAVPSRLPVSFEVIAGSAALGPDGKTLTVGFVAGPVTIRASQIGGAAGGLVYAPATPVDQTFEATLSSPAQSPKIAFAKPPALTYGTAPLTLTATSSSGLPVSYEITSAKPAGIASLADNVLTITGAGTIVVKATQPAAPPYKAAAAVSQTFTINKADLAVSFDDRVRLVAEPNPTFFEPIYAPADFVNGDTPANLVPATRPRGVTAAKISSNQGDYPITFTGGADTNYRYVPGAPAFLHVLGFGGSYEALLVDNDGFSIGKLALAVSKNTLGYTGTLNLARETKAVVVSSTVQSPGTTALVATEDISSASATWVRTGGDTLDALILTFTVNRAGQLTGSLKRNGNAFATLSGGHLLYAPPAKTYIPWAGQHTLALHSAFVPVFTPEETPFPRGSGVATALVSATNGNLVIKGLLADGTKLSATLKPWITRTESGALDQVGYVAWITPYGTRAESFIGGPIHLLPHPETDRFPVGRRYVSLTEGNPLHWKKAGSPKDKSYRDGFGYLNVSVSLDPWLPPVVAKPANGSTPTVEAITLPQRLGVVTNATATADLSIFHGPEELNLGELEEDLPVSATLVATAAPTANTALTALTPSANLAKWKLTAFNPATGAFAGTFELSDQVKPSPAKPAKRTVAFTGTLRQAPINEQGVLLGTGFFLLPPAPGTPAPSPAAEEASGEIRFFRP